MNPEMNTEPETRLRAALQAAYPAADVPETLRQRVNILAAEAVAARTQNRKRRQRQIGLRLAAVAATVITVLAFLFVPHLTAVYAFERMKNSLNNVRSAHYIWWDVNPDGTRVKAHETWYQGGNWRVEDIDSHSQQIQVCRNGLRWTYNAVANTVTQENSALPDGFDGFSGFSIAPSMYNSVVHGNQTHVTLLGKTTVSGRPAHIILLYSQWIYDKQKPSRRSRITVDDATDLPIVSEDQYRTPAETRWVTRSICEYQYNQKLSDAIFTTDFPKTAEFIDAIAGREKWRERLSKGIASQMAGGTSDVITYPNPHDFIHPSIRGTNTPTRIVIRDFQVNARGDVFVLFTANHAVGYGGGEVSAELSDDLSTKYINPEPQQRQKFGYYPTNGNIDPSKVDGYLFNNEMLEGAWWVPDHPQTPWKSRRFTLTLRLPYVGNKGKPTIATFDLPVSKPKSDNLPGYMPYMARPLPADFMDIEEAGIRAYYFQHDTHDLPQALTWYRQEIAINSGREIKFGFPVCNTNEWFEVYHILTEMGRPEEAKAALIQAKKDDDIYSRSPTTHSGIQEAMKKLGMKP